MSNEMDVILKTQVQEGWARETALNAEIDRLQNERAWLAKSFKAARMLLDGCVIAPRAREALRREFFEALAYVPKGLLE